MVAGGGLARGARLLVGRGSGLIIAASLVLTALGAVGIALLLGLDLSLETTVMPERWESPYTGLGSLYAGYGTPTWTGAPGTIIGLSDDFLNQLFYALWGGGILNTALKPVINWLAAHLSFLPFFSDEAVSEASPQLGAGAHS